MYCIASCLFFRETSLCVGLTYMRAFGTALPNSVLSLCLYFLFQVEVINNVHPMVFAFFMILATSVSTVIMSFLFVSKAEAEDDMAARLAKVRIATGESMNDEASFEQPKKTFFEVLQLAGTVAAPSFFILGMILGYVILIFGAFKWFDHLAWQVFVTMVSQVVKIVGNKIGLMR